MDGFGRRIVASDSRELTVVSDTGEPQGLRADLSGRVELKEQVREILMSRIEPAVAARMTRARLLSEIRLLVSAIATEKKV